ncbi:phenylacetate--CoA ligase family protein [Actinosynnema sp. NPDC047251]|uniref:Phenylacetate-CoA ligase n=1 Tax=Saccharothrix espanaensis (strain ATCC 51144 / DSM 44229 / JCM 9112 / NBRC 15066 / NRRL 15764) TaxID=1179773 RepID=K0JZ59_SACES|nr:phenylacetate--CoA ligase family protein [Saccharothrix espanaensis]CCH31416.1 Phenylacetate-CoA ligase [Saccharothrix espanaensis DSM 44229]
MDADRPGRVAEGFRSFFADDRVPESVLELFHRVAATVPAYRKFLAEHGVDPERVVTLDDFRRLPPTDKDNYHRRYPLPELCRDGRLDGCDLVAVSSGSSGRPTAWPRSLVDELAITRRFEQVFRDAFRAHERSTLAVVCFPLGTWVGGLFTTACVRHLAAKGYPITAVAPGNNKAEILRVLPELAGHFEQVVLMGYPPFVKDVVDSAHFDPAGFDWAAHDVKLVLAGEVFSEQWRTLVAGRLGIADPVRATASLYGTADAGVLGNETPLSVSVRRFLAGRPDLARELFGGSRLPTLVQYDPASRFFEEADGTLLFSGDNGIPLIRYHIADEGGLVSSVDMREFLARNGCTIPFDNELPFVFVFGRSLFTVSYFGANVYPENVSVGLEQPGVSDLVTGKFVLEAVSDADEDAALRVTVELAPGRTGDPGVIAESIRAHLVRLNSEFAHYVPAERQLPQVVLRPAGDPEHFPVGVKHRYTRAR